MAQRDITLVLAGFFALSDDEQETILEEIKRVRGVHLPMRKGLVEDIEKRANEVYFGPSPSARCTCCGR